MNKQEVTDELESVTPDFILNDFQRGKETGLIYALELVEQLSDLEKPIVPQFVADRYERYKNDFEYNLYRFCINFHERKLYEDSHKWFKFDKDKSIETPTLIHRFGYEAEKEKLYTAELPNPNSPEHFVLRKNGVNETITDCYLSDNWKFYRNTWLTESEIKKDFEWVWQLAKEAEERN